VIQDDAQTRDLFLEGIKAEGFHTIGAENGLVGIQQVQEKSPDVIICDIIMPELDGYGVLNVAPGSYYSDYPVHFVTANADQVTSAKLWLGADDLSQSRVR